MTQSPPTGELVARLAPSYVVDAGLNVIAHALREHGCEFEAATLNTWIVANNALKREAADAITTLEHELEEERALSERLKLEAQGHAMEARTANSTIYEIYQVLSGGRGEPGNWNGAEPARRYVTASQAEVERLKEALKLCQSVLAMMTAPDAIRSTSVMHAWTHAVEAEATARAALESTP